MPYIDSPTIDVIARSMLAATVALASNVSPVTSAGFRNNVSASFDGSYMVPDSGNEIWLYKPFVDFSVSTI